MERTAEYMSYNWVAASGLQHYCFDKMTIQQQRAADFIVVRRNGIYIVAKCRSGSYKNGQVLTNMELMRAMDHTSNGIMAYNKTIASMHLTPLT